MDFLKRKNKKLGDANLQDEVLLGEDSPFSVKEAYKTIRSNLIFSIPGEKCRKILITSANQHEGKSITAINIAIAFAQNSAKVLVADCDLRLPTCAQKLHLQQSPGLSNVLVGMCGAEDAIRHLENGVDVIPAGEIPPNPSELLGSAEMDDLIRQLEASYEYIIFDAPPVCTVTDAVILSRKMSGVVIVVGNGISSQDNISQVFEQFQLAGSKVLGFIFNGAKDEHKKKYGRYQYGYANSYQK